MPKKFQLTRTRQQWIKGRSTRLKGSALNVSISCEQRYIKRLQRLSEKMAKEVRREVNKLLDSPEGKRYFTQDASIASQARITLNKLTRKYDDAFRALAKPAAKQMISGINKSSKSSLASSFKKMSGGMTIKTDFMTADLTDIITASMVENEDLIKSLSVEYMRHIRGDVVRSITHPEAGGYTRLKKIINATLTAEERRVRNRARNIALDQTRKAYNNLNAGRMRAVGVDQFEWVHSGGGQFPREYHLHVLDGQTFSLSDPPIIDPVTKERGIPGQLINCRCTMLPIIRFDKGELF